MNRWQEFCSLARQDGFKQSSCLAFRFILRKAIGLDWLKATILRRSLEKPIEDITPKIEVEIRQASEDDLILFKDAVDEEKYVSFQQRFNNGHMCFMALYQNNIAGYCWVSFTDEYNAALKTNIKLNDKAKEAYFYDMFVMPEYRNNKLHTSLSIERMKYFRSLGYDNIVTTIHDSNTYSLRAAKTAGFEPSEFVTYIKIFGLKFHSWHKNSL